MKEPQPTPILKEPSSQSMNLQGSIWGHGGGMMIEKKGVGLFGGSSVTKTKSYFGMTENSAMDIVDNLCFLKHFSI